MQFSDIGLSAQIVALAGWAISFMRREESSGYLDLEDLEEFFGFFECGSGCCVCEGQLQGFKQGGVFKFDEVHRGEGRTEGFLRG